MIGVDDEHDVSAASFKFIYRLIAIVSHMHVHLSVQLRVFDMTQKGL